MKYFIRVTLIIIGTMSLILGIIGIFLPLLPTTPFLLLTASCYVRGSEKLYNRLINNKYIGVYIKNYKEGKGIPKKTKIYGLTLVWTTILFSVVFVIPLLLVKLLLLAIASAVTIHIIKIKTLEVQDESDIQ